MSNHWLVSNETSTEILVTLFHDLSIPKTVRDQSFIFLTFRFRKRVLNTCEILCKRYKHDVSTAEMIADKTFESYARKGTFDITKGRGKDYDESFLLYLYSIAENELISYYRDLQRKAKSPYDGTESIVFDIDPLSLEELNQLSLKVRIGYDIVSKLPSDKRAIYLTYTKHQRKGFKMPRQLLERMRTELNLQQNTINAYLKDVRDLIEKAISAAELAKKLNDNE